jgi:hypothetical protein
MRVALVNPPWSFEGSICFGCREPHLPLELRYSAAMLDAAGHRTLMLDAHLCGSGMADTAEAVAEFRVRGECEEILLRLEAEGDLARIPAIAFRDRGEIRITGAPHAGEFSHLAALRWPDEWVCRQRHHHHRFDARPDLIRTPGDDPELFAAWRERLQRGGVWANDPVPLYPYPSSPDYHRLWGAPGDHAWEPAHARYLGQFGSFSDIQDEHPLALAELEALCPQ